MGIYIQSLLTGNECPDLLFQGMPNAPSIEVVVVGLSFLFFFSPPCEKKRPNLPAPVLIGYTQHRRLVFASSLVYVEIKAVSCSMDLF